MVSNFFSLVLNLSLNSGTLIIVLSWTPSPIFSILSSASTSKVTLRLLTLTTLAFNLISAPTGVAFKCLILTRVPTESHFSSCKNSSFNNNLQVSSISEIIEGVENTFSPFNKKLVLWPTFTLIFLSFAAPFTIFLTMMRDLFFSNYNKKKKVRGDATFCVVQRILLHILNQLTIRMPRVSILRSFHQRRRLVELCFRTLLTVV